MDIKQKINSMTLEEKIGQKIMLDFRYWNLDGKNNTDMVAPDETIAKLMMDNHIGGVILFANNLKDKMQMNTLIGWYAAMKICSDIRLFIGTDNEGGKVFRLPRSNYSSFPGNMALCAAIEGGGNPQLASEQGRILAQDMLCVHINTNFAPVVDVNANPVNPVINVRAFSDDANTVSWLAEEVAAGMKRQHLITVYKHFPGHGSTSTDSHTSLPRVDRSKEEAFAIDIAPYKHAIDKQVAPDMIMAAHIQYPALDNSQVCTRHGDKIIVPATLSWEIQTRLLRGQLGYDGVTISDALDMGAIADLFSQDDAIEQVFTAGVDIALMPVSISSPSQVNQLSELIGVIADKIKKGVINAADIDASVERILNLKQRYHLLGKKQETTCARALSDEELEKQIADHSITVVINRQLTLPLRDKTQHYFILTPWEAQAKSIAAVMTHNGYQHVIFAKQTELTDKEIREKIAECDVFLFATLSASFTPVKKNSISSRSAPDNVRDGSYLGWLRYAGEQGKKRVHLSLCAPYDIIYYAKDVEASVATYSYGGYDNGIWHGYSMISLGEVLTGKRPPQGKLPVNIWHDYDVQTHTGTVAFRRGFGLSW